MSDWGSQSLRAIPFAIRLHREFRGVTVREGMLIEGPSGWGEFAPFHDYDDEAAGRWLAAALEAAFGTWPSGARTSISCNAIIPAVTPEVARVLAAQAAGRDGCSTIKVKVTGDLATDEARVAAIRDALDASLGAGVGLIRIDANGCWSREAALEAITVLSRYGLEYVEQPVESRDDLRAVHAAVDVPIAVDESIRTDRALTPASLRDLVEIADVAIIKPAPVGGVSAGVRIAEAVGLPVVISSSMDSSIGMCASLALASALDVDRACGLGTGALLATDLTVPTLVPIDGAMDVCRLAPDRDALDAARGLVTDERAIFWERRLAGAWDSQAAAPWRALLTSSA